MMPNFTEEKSKVDRKGLIELNRNILSNLFPSNTANMDKLNITTKRILRKRPAKAKQNEENINHLKVNKQGNKNSKGESKQNKLSQIALLKKQAQNIDNDFDSEQFRWQDIVENKASQREFKKKEGSKVKQIRGIRLHCVQNIQVGEKHRLEFLKAFCNSFSNNFAAFPPKTQSGRNDRCFTATKKPSSRKSSATCSKGTTIIVPDEQQQKLIQHSKTFNMQQIRTPKDLSYPFRRYFTANKTRRRSVCTSHVSGRAMKKQTILNQFTMTL